MKKLVALILSLLCVFSGVSYIFAQDKLNNNMSTSIEYLEDGSYIVTEIKEISNDLARAYKTGTKSTSYYTSSGKVVWKYELTGSFSYGGSYASCVGTSSRVTYTTDGWREESKTSYASGASAVGKITMRQVGIGGGTKSDTVVLTCSPSGVLS